MSILVASSRNASKAKAVGEDESGPARRDIPMNWAPHYLKYNTNQAG